MPSEKTIQEVTKLLASANPWLAIAMPYVFKIFDRIQARKNPEAELTEEEKKQLILEAKASLAEFQRLVTQSDSDIKNWIATHPPDPSDP